MESIKTAWDFFQNEILGMHWLNRLINTTLNACGIDTTGRIGGSVWFFIYDTVKIMVLLGFLILERKRKKTKRLPLALATAVVLQVKSAKSQTIAVPKQKTVFAA